MAIIKLDLFQINANNTQSGQVISSNGSSARWANGVYITEKDGRPLISIGDSSVNTQIFAGDIFLNGSSLVIGNTANALSFTDGGISVGQISILPDVIVISNTVSNTVYISGSHINIGIVSANLTSISVGTNVYVSSYGINVGSVGINTSSLQIGNTYISGDNIKIGNVAISNTGLRIGDLYAVVSQNPGVANDSLRLAGTNANQYITVANNYTISGVYTYNSNIVLGNSASIIANNSPGLPGQVLAATGNGVTWVTGRLDILEDVVEGTPSNGHILTYVAENDKYYVLPLNLTGQALDGGNF